MRKTKEGVLVYGFQVVGGEEAVHRDAWLICFNTLRVTYWTVASCRQPVGNPSSNRRDSPQVERLILQPDLSYTQIHFMGNAWMDACRGRGRAYGKIISTESQIV